MKTVDNFMNAAPPRSIREDSLYFGHRVCAIRIDARKEVARDIGYWIRCNNVPDAVENMRRMLPWTATQLCLTEQEGCCAPCEPDCAGPVYDAQKFV